MKPPSTRYQPPPHQGLDILYRDDDLLALNKPAGLLSVPGRGPDKQDCLALRVQREFPLARVVHRLDMETSGILLMALHATAQRQLGRLFEQRKVNKNYVAIVAGCLKPVQGEITQPLACDWPNRPRQRIDPDRGKAALTRYQVILYDPGPDTTRVQLTPVTGRSHQLRVHLQWLGHAIVGDRLYADKAIAERSTRLLLHAEELILPHPVTDEPLLIDCPAPF